MFDDLYRDDEQISLRTILEGGTKAAYYEAENDAYADEVEAKCYARQFLESIGVSYEF